MAIDTIKIENLKRGKESIVATLYKDDHASYKYSVKVAYLKDNKIVTRHSDYIAGNIKDTAMKKFDESIKRMIKKGYKNECV